MIVILLFFFLLLLLCIDDDDKDEDDAHSNLTLESIIRPVRRVSPMLCNAIKMIKMMMMINRFVIPRFTARRGAVQPDDNIGLVVVAAVVVVIGVGVASVITELHSYNRI